MSLNAVNINNSNNSDNNNNANKKKIFVDCIYFLVQQQHQQQNTNNHSIDQDDTESEDALKSLLGMSIPESIAILYFHPFTTPPPKHVLQIEQDHQIEFPNVQMQRFHTIQSTHADIDPLPLMLEHCRSMNVALSPIVQFSMVLPADILYLQKYAAQIHQVMSEMTIKSNCGRLIRIFTHNHHPQHLRHIDLNSQMLRSIPVLTDIHQESIGRLVQTGGEQWRDLFQDTIKKCARLMLPLSDKTVFCAGKFQDAFNLHYLPFSSLIIFNELLRLSILIRATAEEARSIIHSSSGRSHVYHLLNKQFLDSALNFSFDWPLETTSAVTSTWPIVSRAFLQTPPISPLITETPLAGGGTRFRDLSKSEQNRRFEFETRLKSYIAHHREQLWLAGEEELGGESIDYHQITPFNCSGETFKERLDKFARIHFGKQFKLDFKTRKKDNLFRGLMGHHVSTLSIAPGLWDLEGAYAPSSAEAIENTAKSACMYLDALQQSAQASPQNFRGPLGKLLLLIMKPQADSQQPDRKKQKTQELKQQPSGKVQNAKELLHIYCGILGASKPECQFTSDGKQFRAEMKIFNRSWSTVKAHDRKVDARTALADQILQNLNRKMKFAGHLQFSPLDFS